MRVYFQPLGRHAGLRRILQADGWLLKGDRGDAFLAEHPGVADQAAARRRLDRLGLLTSSRLRIAFLPLVGPHRRE
jgi:hypothetical protein